MNISHNFRQLDAYPPIRTRLAGRGAPRARLQAIGTAAQPSERN